MLFIIISLILASYPDGNTARGQTKHNFTFTIMAKENAAAVAIATIVSVQPNGKGMPDPTQPTANGFKTGFVAFPDKIHYLTAKMGEKSVIVKLDRTGSVERLTETVNEILVKAFKPREYFFNGSDWLAYVAKVANVTDVVVSDAKSTQNLRSTIDEKRYAPIVAQFAAERAKGDGDTELLAEKLKSENLTARNNANANLKAITVALKGPVTTVNKIVLTEKQKQDLATAKTNKDNASKNVTAANSAVKQANNMIERFGLAADNELVLKAKAEVERATKVLGRATLRYKGLKADPNFVPTPETEPATELPAVDPVIA